MSDLPVISVTQLVAAFKEVVETALPPCCVEGEISNCRCSPAGHYYLTLKDEGAEIGAVIWRGTAERLKFQPKDGMQVLATGSLQVYAVRGSCQFIINRLMPQGVGELELAFRQVKEKLAKEGLFDDSRKRPLPRFPKRIALVTSPTGAAVRDMIQVIIRRWPAARVIIVPVPVQGEAAAGRIAKALRLVHRIPDVDVVITGRGGGSLEDLWAFNEEVVARAVAACKVPVVSAVGHEIDVSISDLVADRRALTPSEAAELVTPSQVELSQQLIQLRGQMHRLMTAKIDRLRSRIDALRDRPVLKRPMALIEARRQMLDDLAERADRSIRLSLERCRQKVTTIAATLDALSPLKVLSRGYSLTTNEHDEIIRSIAATKPGRRITTRVHDGTIQSVVESVE